MRQISLALAGLLIVGLFTWGACQNSRGPGPGMARQQALSDSLDRGYERLQARYRQMGDSLTPSMRQMAGSMQQMHRQMMGRPDSMQGMQGGGMQGRQQGMRGRGMMAHHQQMHGGAAREWHQQMMAMHDQMAQMHQRQHPEMAAQHRKMAQWHRQIGGTVSADTSSAPSAPAELSGQTIYQQQCATCHGADGQGVAGVFPPLAGSEWVQGDDETLARILLHGLQGPVEVDGRPYNSVMPAFGERLSDAEIAATLTYVRSLWGNNAADVTESDVQEVRSEYRGRQQPWAVEALQEEE